MSGRLLLRFAKVSSFSVLGMAVASKTMSWPWSVVLAGLISGVIAVLQKWFKIITTEKQLK